MSWVSATFSPKASHDLGIHISFVDLVAILLSHGVTAVAVLELLIFSARTACGGIFLSVPAAMEARLESKLAAASCRPLRSNVHTNVPLEKNGKADGVIVLTRDRMILVMLVPKTHSQLRTS